MRALITWAVTGLLLFLISPHLLAQEKAMPKEIVLENDTARLVLGTDGAVRAFARHGGASLLDGAKGATPFMLLRIGGKWHNAASLTATGDGNERRLQVGFWDAPKLAAHAVVRIHPKYFEIETLSLEGPGNEAVEQLIYVNLPVNIKENLGGWLNVAWNDAFAATVIALEEKTQAGGTPLLRACADRRLGLGGRKAAIIACPRPEVLNVIRDIEREHNLPSPTLGGHWAKTSTEARKSWMITAITASNPQSPVASERIFALAKSLGVEYIVMGLYSWNSTFGHYAINTKNFPEGIASLKKTADQAHALGLKLGIHIMTASITKNDAYVTPVPDPRLRKEGEVTLAADVDAAAKEIPTQESPAAFGTASGYWARGGVDVQIDQEIIRYEGLRDAAPFALTGCKRGAYGTRPAPHKAGAKVVHIAERFTWYVADNDLAAEIGRNIADIINAAGLDMVCFDGADVLHYVDPELQFFSGHQVPFSVLRHAQRDVLLISNGTTHFGWYVVTRGGEDDAMARGYKRWNDGHTVHGWGAWHWRNLLVPDFSWVGIFGHTPTLTATRPDDVELVCARSLGYGGVIGWGFAAAYGGPSGADTFARNGRKDEIAGVVRTYEKLRLENYFSSQERAPLQAQGSEWRLLPPDGANARYRLAPVRYLKSGIIRSGVAETESWKVNNDLSAQPLRVRVEALPALAPYGAKENVVLADFGKLTFEPGGNPAAKIRFERTAEMHPQAGAVARLSCVGPVLESKFPQKLSGHGQPAWAQASANFPAKLNLTGHRAVGLWIKGDGGGETLNVQVEVTPQSYLHFYQTINFTGWRYCELGEPEGDRVMDYYAYDKFALHNLKLDSFTGFTLMVLNPPRGKSVELLIGRIEALKEIGGGLENLQLTVGGASITLPVTLEPEQYLETSDLWNTRDPAACRVFDAGGNELRRLTLPGPLPTIPAGETSLRFSIGGQPAARAKVTVVLLGQ